MSAAAQFSTHGEPVWRERANFIINASLPEEGRFEQLWTRQLGENLFQVCCIPFFLYDIALGDTVETAPQSDRQYVLNHVRQRAGRYVFRAVFERRQYHYRDETVEAVKALGSLVEWSSPRLLAIDVENDDSAKRVARLLQASEDGNRLVYETGKTA